ncbi:prephenate dehydrogenase [Micromonospora craniellae]|uniref:Prephenate dehydrogenase/arogenate dehydrogenase family protein n=1 Tax=Micromonospora craniellae TaxID=2294034 RepID=A0A372G573_9ACTN|nr:prephenate dehydrogenase/arogenate dehydrogenase family protein [Micromonospora craniellae]QOC90446.1 prephenate dehydrogenase/arogenate dehydrogenase family protein [Micromonospora craniellae]RFS48165.1 prephenate dehydrogenase/arogenate dehydrogenase family protein [Micromonospora craniellae]
MRAAVLGTGLIGGSVLLRLHAAGLDVTGWDPDDATRRQARLAGVPTAERLADAVAGRDVVFLGGPLPTLPATLVKVAAATAPDCLLTDVGSTKAELAAFAAARGLTHRFVPGHPMAGTDRAGLGAARPELFAGAAWVLCPAPDGLVAFRRLAALVTEVIGARVVPMAADRHDAVAALSSHVPHLLAGALAGAAQRSPLRDAVLTLAAGSFRDGTRVAGTPAPRTANMLRGNRDQVLAALAEVTAYLDELAHALRAGDGDTLTARYAEAGAARVALAGRPYQRTVRPFPVDGEAADEVAWLTGLGASGGHLSGCQVTGEAVFYTARLPQAG